MQAPVEARPAAGGAPRGTPLGTAPRVDDSGSVLRPTDYGAPTTHVCAWVAPHYAFTAGLLAVLAAALHDLVSVLVGITAAAMFAVAVWRFVQGLPHLARWADEAEAVQARGSRRGVPDYDLAWRTDGETRQAGLSRYSGSMASAIAVPFVLVVFAQSPRSTATYYMGAAVAALVATWWLYMQLRLWTSGTITVRYETFPYPVGATTCIPVAFSPDAACWHDATARLECVEETSCSYATGFTDRYVRRVVWSAPPCDPGSFPPEPGSESRLTFDVPGDLPATSLRGGTRVRWELHLRGRTGLGKRHETFLIPMYRDD